MAIFKKRGKTGIRYLVRVKDRYGRHFPAKTFKRRVDAEKHEVTLRARRDQGKLAHSQEVVSFTFGDYWLKWASTMRGHVLRGLANVSRSNGKGSYFALPC